MYIYLYAPYSKSQILLWILSWWLCWNIQIPVRSIIWKGSQHLAQLWIRNRLFSRFSRLHHFVHQFLGSPLDLIKSSAPVGWHDDRLRILVEREWGSEGRSIRRPAGDFPSDGLTAKSGVKIIQKWLNKIISYYRSNIFTTVSPIFKCHELCISKRERVSQVNSPGISQITHWLEMSRVKNIHGLRSLWK